ncbi:autotransporter domain-containing protein [Cupriavidus sp. AU9028]|uniref:autotransporter domain-containing protein n=1 Tax=Cupriavidus sp. AU9028 TaxID=2871157 RepID=UPI001C955C95|nr:autotransporter domain-containing protein [Cupriavidus sp. AU9028]MBY4897236.1 autotransporter domain-containing protein [Cupriavidus sp. AU9028]
MPALSPSLAAQSRRIPFRPNPLTVAVAMAIALPHHAFGWSAGGAGSGNGAFGGEGSSFVTGQGSGGGPIVPGGGTSGGMGGGAGMLIQPPFGPVGTPVGYDGQAGTDGSAATTATGGGGGGAGVVVWNSAAPADMLDVVVTSNAQGGAGGAGGNSDPSPASVGYGAGGGGGGGAGLFGRGALRLSTSGTLVGGTGGRGGLAVAYPDGSGGSGGHGVYSRDLMELTNSGNISGGEGGGVRGGIGQTVAGNGGSGVRLESGIVSNRGTIAGGDAGRDASTGYAGAGGFGVDLSAGTLDNAGLIRGGAGNVGGVGVRLSGGVMPALLVNSGTITGGLGGAVRADAVQLGGTLATLELQPGSVIVGNVVNQAMVGNLRLGGTGSGSFDVSALGAQYHGFDSFTKTGNSTWVLAGTTTLATPWRIEQGTLEIGAEGSLGSAAYGATLAGGTLRVNVAAPVNLSRSLTLAASSSIEVADASVVLSGSIDGGGDLIKAGPGRLRLSGANSYGNTRVAAGQLDGTLQSIRGDIFSDAVVVLLDSADQTHDGNIAALTAGSNTGRMRSTGAGTLTLTGNNSLDWQIDAGAVVSSARRFSGAVSLGAPTATFVLDETADTAFAGRLSGAGVLRKRGAGMLTLQGDSGAFGGRSVVEGGTLAVTGQLGGAVEVGSGATLTGTGTVGATVVDAGGTLAAESNAGTLHIDGGLDLRAGSTLRTTLGTPSATPLFDVTGSLNLNGTLSIADGGGFGAGVYRLIDYTGSLSGAGLAIAAVPGVDAADLRVQTAVANQVNLINTSGVTLQFWDGGDSSRHGNGVIDGGAGTWTADANTWTDDSGQLNGRIKPAPGFAVFQGAAGIVSVDRRAGHVAVTGMQFARDGYRVRGDSLALAGPDGHSIVNVGDGTAAGAAMTATISSALTGDSALVKQGQGTLVLGGANTYTGGTQIRGGTLRISGDNNLGDGAGGLTLAGGTLAVSADVATARQVTLIGSGGFDVADGATLALHGSIGGQNSGQGTLRKSGQGTLRLVGAGDYAATEVAAGTLIGDTSSVRGDIASAGTVVFDQQSDGIHAGAISGFAGGNGSMVKRGRGTLTLAGASALDWSIEAGQLVASAQRYRGNAAVGAAGTLVLDDAADTRFAGVLSGTGAVAKTGSGTLALSGDSSAFAGTTTVSAGTLSVGDGGPGALGGLLHVRNGATLTGSGTVGTTVLAGGATLAPGAGVGTLRVQGDLTFSPGASYRVEAAPDGSSDRVEVAGTARIEGGSVIHVGPDGHFAPAMRYTILRAGAVQGRFDTVASDYAYLSAGLDYSDPATIQLTLERRDNAGAQIRFADLARSANQRAVANALETLPSTHALYQAVLTLPEGAPPAAFNALSGEAHASTATALQNAAMAARAVPMQRLRANLNAGLLPGAATAQTLLPPQRTVMTDAPTTSAAVLPRSAAMPAWAEVVGNWDRLRGGEAAAIRQNTAGIFVGADHPVGESRWRMGASFGYTDGRLRADDVGSSADIRSYNAALFTGASYEAGAGKLNIMLGGAYAWHDIETQRRVGVASLAQTLTAGYSANTSQLFTEIGYAQPLGARATVEPFIGAAWSDQRTRGFTEAGGNAALSGQATRSSLPTTSLGVRGQATVAVGRLDLDVTGALGWRHAFGDVTPETRLAFQGSQVFTVAGTPIARDAALVELGASARVSERMAIGLGYSGQFGEGNRAHAGNVQVRWKY